MCALLSCATGTTVADALGFTFGRCWWGISRASMASAGSRGGRRIRWRCGGFC